MNRDVVARPLLASHRHREKHPTSVRT
jgi:hypothetical protein